MVNARTYPLWQQPAVTEGLPSEALPAVIEALCRPSHAFYGVDNRREEWRKKAFADALPTGAGWGLAPFPAHQETVPGQQRARRGD
ncbi:hypothetical protein [Streptomyces milbemycinicus]|uniref:hypothetical protein n=1 Tax=Streptomyces milbemycinicus TaxID=476552 RepID=UPI00340DCB50